jgi:hypothetical protein
VIDGDCITVMAAIKQNELLRRMGGVRYDPALVRESLEGRPGAAAVVKT